MKTSYPAGPLSPAVLKNNNKTAVLNGEGGSFPLLILISFFPLYIIVTAIIGEFFLVIFFLDVQLLNSRDLPSRIYCIHNIKRSYN